MPVGLVASSYGGTPIVAWSDPLAVQRCNASSSSPSPQQQQRQQQYLRREQEEEEEQEAVVVEGALGVSEFSRRAPLCASFTHTCTSIKHARTCRPPHHFFIF